MRITLASAAVGLCVLGAGLVAAPLTSADDGEGFHILSAQDLCNLVWPSSQAQPNPGEFGLICVRQGGVLFRLSRDMPDIFHYTFTPAPGKAPELPKGSVRVDPTDPLSDWIIPDCHVPGRIDCQNP